MKSSTKNKLISKYLLFICSFVALIIFTIGLMFIINSLSKGSCVDENVRNAVENVNTDDTSSEIDIQIEDTSKNLSGSEVEQQ